jgi:hypothetical protein
MVDPRAGGGDLRALNAFGEVAVEARIEAL